MKRGAIVAAWMVGCGACTKDAPLPAMEPSADASPTRDAGGDTDASTSGMSEAGLATDAGHASYTASAALHIYRRLGSMIDDQGSTAGPGIVLDGGYGDSTVQQWMHRTSVGAGTSRADVVVLSAGGGDASNGWLSAASFRSVQTIALGTGATSDDYAIAATIVARSEIVWLTGGDQAMYARWKGTALMDAVDGVYRRGGVVGGTSAGMIVLGQHVNDALVTISENITTPVALANPYDSRIHFTQSVVHFDRLARVITDPHFIARDRMGRLSSFMARQVKDGFAMPDVLGVGIDDGAALVIDPQGLATRLSSSDVPAAYIVRGGEPMTAMAGSALVYRNLHMVKIARSTHTYDFVRRCGRGFVRNFDVDANSSPPYSANVYGDGTFANECP